MSKKAMKLALEALENSRSLEPVDVQWVKGKRHAAITALREALAEQPAPVAKPHEQESVGYVAENGVVDWNVCAPPILTDLYTSPQAQRKPLTHEQRVDLLAKFEVHKHEWHAPAILIDMVEAAHGIKENT